MERGEERGGSDKIRKGGGKKGFPQFVVVAVSQTAMPPALVEIKEKEEEILSGGEKGGRKNRGETISRAHLFF